MFSPFDLSGLLLT